MIVDEQTLKEFMRPRWDKFEGDMYFTFEELISEWKNEEDLLILLKRLVDEKKLNMVGNLITPTQIFFPNGEKSEELPEEFFDEKKFNPEKLAKSLCEKFIIKTDKEGNSYIYNEEKGIYEKNVESIIEHESVFRLKKLNKSFYIKEIMPQIRFLTRTSQIFFENNPNLLKLENGIYNIINNIFIEGKNPNIFFISKLPIIYDTSAKCEKFLKFLDEILKKEDILNIQEFFGYCFYKKYTIHKAFMLVGEGSNGKSTLLSVLKTLLGGENIASVSIQTLVEHPFSIATLEGKLANIHADLPDRALFQTGVFKQLTSGDSLNAFQKFKQKPILLDSHAKQIFSCNKIPESYDNTDAFFRRWIIINFPNKFEGDKIDENLTAKLITTEEISGIFNWAIIGLQRLLKQRHFSYEKTTEDIRKQYIHLSNSLQAFIMDCVIQDINSSISKDEFYNMYVEYCQEHNYMIKTKDKVGKEIGKHIQVETSRIGEEGNRKLVWRGIKVETI